MRTIITAFLILCLPILQGCIPLMVAGAGYAIGQGRKGTAAEMEAKGKFLDRYNAYKLGMENINLEREKAKLEPKPIDDFEVWLDKQPLTPEEQNLYRKYKAQTPNEYKQKDIKKEESVKPAEQPTTQPATQPSSNFKG